eukprot:12106239-Alexandrium_andersonii.AAC.1
MAHHDGTTCVLAVAQQAVWLGNPCNLATNSRGCSACIKVLCSSVAVRLVDVGVTQSIVALGRCC